MVWLDNGSPILPFIILIQRLKRELWRYKEYYNETKKVDLIETTEDNESAISSSDLIKIASKSQ